MSVATPVAVNNGALDLSSLRAGQRVLLSGTLFTARDRAHRFLLEHDLPQLHGGIVYHCGPIVQRVKNKDALVSAGPTTSARLNPYAPALIEKYGLRAIVGKGGMDSSVLAALKGRAVYFAAVGGAAVLAADRMKVKAVHHPEFGMTEAIWELEASAFPVVVAMDSHGASIYDAVRTASEKNWRRLTS